MTSLLNPYNLPQRLTSFIGRERELAEVKHLLSTSRLLTLIGPPGIGKTRLGLEVATCLVDAFRDGVYFAPLAPISDPDLVMPTIAQTIGVKENAGEPLLQSLQSYLKEKQTLLLLDNFEQLVSAAPLLAELLEACPGLKLLVTSRELLRLYGEHNYPVPPLSLPPLPEPNRLLEPEALSRHEAVALFMQRAQAVNPGFQLTNRNAHAVAEICLRLEGLPLAIELAAARILVLPPEELLARLTSKLTLLTGGARNLPERHQTLQAAIDWSYNLLDPDEQTLFRRLGVFLGGCTLHSTTEVCCFHLRMDSLDGVTSLIGKSLLQRQGEHDMSEAGGEPRFTMLETVREYARDKLENAGELDSTADRHLDYFVQLAEAAEQGTLGNELAQWMRRLDAEHYNLRAALEWSLSREGRAEQGLRLAGALMRYWDNRGYFSEGRQWCTRLLTKIEQGPERTRPSTERAKVLRALAGTLWEQGDFSEASSPYEASLAMSKALGDDWGVAAALLGLGNVAMWSGEYDLSLSLDQECLVIGRRLGDTSIVSGALSNMGIALVWKGEYRAAQSPLEEALAIDRELGDIAGIAGTLLPQGVVACGLGEYEQAKALIEESLSMAREVGLERIIAGCLAQLGRIALREGDPQLAQTLLLEGVTRGQVSGTRRWSRWYLVGLADVAHLRGMVTRAAKLIGASEGDLSAYGAHYERAISTEIDRIIASVRTELDEETFTRLVGEGRAMLLEEAAAYATESNATSPSRLERPHAPAGTSSGSQESGPPGDREPTPYPGHLTEREVEVLRLIAAGKSNQEIASELVLSLRTVERHISNIYQKIGATGKVGRASAATYALTHRLGNELRVDRQAE